MRYSRKSLFYRLKRKKICALCSNIRAGRLLECPTKCFESRRVAFESKYLSQMSWQHFNTEWRTTFPELFIKALKCEVLFPGALVASITCASSGGMRTTAGKHLQPRSAKSKRLPIPGLRGFVLNNRLTAYVCRIFFERCAAGKAEQIIDMVISREPSKSY